MAPEKTGRIIKYVGISTGFVLVLHPPGQQVATSMLKCVCKDGRGREQAVFKLLLKFEEANLL